jgi:hypothetical protein
VISFTLDPPGTPVAFEPSDVVLAGYTGRDQAAVRRHVEELAAHGVPAPKKVPAFYRVTPGLVAATDRIAVLGPHTSGEGEFILFRFDGELVVGVASDHTDRALEREDVAKSKQLCTKVVGGTLWRLADVLPHWGHMTLRSFSDDGPRPYQEGPVEGLLDPEEIWRLVSDRAGGAPEGLLVFSGTLPLAGELAYGSRFAVELVDERHDRRLSVAYDVEVHPLLD